MSFLGVGRSSHVLIPDATPQVGWRRRRAEADVGGREEQGGLHSTLLLLVTIIPSLLLLNLTIILSKPAHPSYRPDEAGTHRPSTT